jgi:hypothetical protein
MVSEAWIGINSVHVIYISKHDTWNIVSTEGPRKRP